MRPSTIPLALIALATEVMSVPTDTGISRTLAAREAPCDAWSEECYEVITANACFAAYIRGTNKSRILDCVDVNDHTVAERKICNCYGCSETTVQNWAVKTLGCPA
ncbi:hypothetical protein V8F20_005089 [Naviculisporaceae sp. PSN 640]